MFKVSAHAGFEALRKRAKRWLKAIRRGDAAALDELRRWLPHASETPGLREVQQAIAREQGHGSWALLKESCELQALNQAERLAEYLRCACLSYDRDDWPSKWRRAERLRVRNPELAHAGIHAAAVSGELARVRELLAQDPSLAHAPGGPQAWVPLLFVCYGRVANPAAVDIARMLLECGADANAHFVMGDGDYRFSAMTGAIGQGELGQPEHPQAEALVRLLLEHGARAADSQALYNTHLQGDDPRWLELLFGSGLDARARVDWGSGAATSGTLFDYLLPPAVASGHVRRTRWLLSHGADPNARGNGGTSCHHAALLAGHADVAALLLEHGARLEPLTVRDAFVAACARGDRDEAARLLSGHAEYLTHAKSLIDAAQNGNLQVVELLLHFGMDPNIAGVHGHHALHVASTNLAMCELLLRHGADPRSRAYGGTVAGWALHGGNRQAALFHAERSRSLLDAAATGHVALARELLEADRACVLERSPTGDTALHLLTDDREAAEVMLPILLAAGADRHALNAAGLTPAQSLEARGLDELADLLEATSI